MSEQPSNPDPDPGAGQPGSEDQTLRDSEAMLRGKPAQDPLIGTAVDQYSIKRVIGEGGMGVVYEALQQSPRRTVALKMMKQGVTSKSALRRFEYEAQTLGRLRHDGIAQIYEAGTWDDGSGGRPWFAMEYLPGAKTLTRYCKDKKYGTRERLDIFNKVCAAVQHGHAKGIIHRDLKPSNILVTSSGVPKVIDFGVARSTDSDLAVTTLQTDVGALIGTLQYMSPEQCDADPNDIDTRSDVYALGVLLYELLCDQPPYTLRHAAIHEAARIIREEEPTKPSSLDKRLRGDIETITLKALEKDRDRRYQSATALEEDIDRYLAGDPIAAKAPSAIDYLKRFARKHKAAAVSISAIFVVLVAAVIAISIFAVEAKRQREDAEFSYDLAITSAVKAKEVKDFVTTMLSSVDPATAKTMDKELMKLVLSRASESVGKQFEHQPWVEAEIRSLIGSTYMSIGQLDEAEPHLVEALDIRRSVLRDTDPDMLDSISDMGALLYKQGKSMEAMPYLQEALEKRLDALGNYDPKTLQSVSKMGDLFYQLSKWEEAMPYYAEALEGHRFIYGEEHPDTLVSIGKMGLVLNTLGRREEAIPYYEQALEGQRRTLGNEHPNTLGSIGNMGILLAQQGRLNEAMPYFREVLEIQRLVHGDEHSDTLASISNMGKLLALLGNLEEAGLYLREGLETSRRILGNEHPETLRLITNMGDLLYRQGKYDEAMVYIIEAFETERRVHGDENPDTLLAMHNVGSLLMSQDKYEEAMPYLREALEKRRQLLGDLSEDTLFSFNAMGRLLSRQGQYEEAMPYYTQALETRREVLGDTHPDTLTSIGDMGDLLLDQERYDEAMPYIREALETSRSELSDENPKTLTAMGRMGNLLFKQGKYEEAMVYLREGLEIQRRILGDEHPTTLWTITLISELHESWNETEPGAGHDVTAAEYRSMLEVIEAEMAETDKPAGH